MADPASSTSSVGLPLSAGIAGGVVDLLGFPAPVLAIGLAAAGLGMVHARTMRRWQAVLVWLGSALCAAAIGSGAAELAWLLLPAAMTSGRPVAQSVTGLCVILAGFAMHPLLRWVGDRFPAVADAAARRAGLDLEPEEKQR